MFYDVPDPDILALESVFATVLDTTEDAPFFTTAVTAVTAPDEVGVFIILPILDMVVAEKFGFLIPDIIPLIPDGVAEVGIETFGNATAGKDVDKDGSFVVTGVGADIVGIEVVTLDATFFSKEVAALDAMLLIGDESIGISSPMLYR